ncbi:MAG: hypothetical protein ACRDSN_18480 [Pseudonocardiaceae bacterium]
MDWLSRWGVRASGAVLGMMIAALTIATPQAAAESPGTLATPPYVGMQVCKNGSTTGYTCGYVTAINVTVCNAQGCIYGLAQTTMYSAPGDQGAPVYHRREVIGTVVGTAGGRTYFDPI